MRGQRIFLAALLLSLLAHLIAAGSSSHWWTPPAPEIPFPIEARLLEIAPAPTLAAPLATVRAKPQAEVKLAARPVPPAEVEVAAPPPAAEAMPPAQVANPVRAVEPLVPAPEPVPPSDPPSAVSPPPATSRALRNLPERIALRYGVQSGEDGFTVGQTTYSGRIGDGRYSLVSVTEATGIAALFVSGKIIQTSEGKVTASGLQPEQFWSAKGEKRLPPVRFDWPQQRLLLPSGGVDLPPQAQDLLSFPFHLAMRVREDDAAWSLPVTNGKKLREYGFQVLGREVLELTDERVETLRLQGSRSGEGSLDVWLAPARSWLPVRIRTLDQKGKVIVLTLQEGAD